MPVFAEDIAHEKPITGGPSSYARYLLGNLEDHTLSLLRHADEYMPTGFPILDSYLVADSETELHEVGIARPHMVVLGAQPKAGKSIWIATLAEYRAAMGDFIIHLDFENGLKRFTSRMLCRRAKVSLGVLRSILTGKDTIRGRTITNDERDRVAEAINWRRQYFASNYMFVDNQPITQDTITIWLDDLQRAGISRVMLILDSLQKLPLPGASSERRLNIDKWTKFVDGITKKYNLTSFCVSELKRSRESNSYQTGNAMFKESGDIEYTADMSLVLREKDRDTSILEIVFSRDGVKGDVAEYTKVRPHFGIVEYPLGQAPTSTDSNPKASHKQPNNPSEPAKIPKFLRDKLNTNEWQTPTMLATKTGKPVAEIIETLTQAPGTISHDRGFKLPLFG